MRPPTALLSENLAPLVIDFYRVLAVVGLMLAWICLMLAFIGLGLPDVGLYWPGFAWCWPDVGLYWPSIGWVLVYVRSSRLSKCELCSHFKIGVTA